MSKKALALTIVFVFIFIQASGLIIFPAAAVETNLALNKPVYYSGVEYGKNDSGDWIYPQFVGEKLTDGDMATRWSSDKSLTKLDLSENPNQNVWAYIDLGTVKSIGKIVLHWQNACSRNYDIQSSNNAEDWSVIKHYENNSVAGPYTETLNPSEPLQARYIRIYARVGTDLVSFNSTNISLFEIEIFDSGNISELEQVLNNVVKTDPVLSSDGKTIVLPASGNGDITVNIAGSGNTAVVALDGRMTKPLIDTQVNIFYKVTDGNGNSLTADKANHITVQGQYQPAAGDNAKPDVVPALREWKGGTGNFTFKGKIVIANAGLKPSADMAAFYIKEMTRMNVTVTTGTPAAGDIYFVSADNDILGGEGYEIEITEILTVKASEDQGFLYAGATIAQIMAQQENKNTVPKGNVRDYPQYKVRSFMIDVGRLFIPIDYLKDITLYAAYFKINEIHIHISDNGGESKSALRIESKKFPKLNNGGLYYTQEEYKNYQKETAKYGIDVITEIDTPAHSGFIAYERPDLVIDNWAIDITKPDALPFVKELLSEFLDGEDPVFRSSKFHVGTDEYDRSDSETMRAYMNNLFEFINAKGLETRFWATLGKNGFHGNTPVTNQAVTYFWAHSLADFDEMLDMGYKFINAIGPVLYIVPAPGGFKNYFDIITMYDTWEASDFTQGSVLEAGHPQMLGASASLWNDTKNGYSEFDIFDRLYGQIMLMSEKTWFGEKQTGQTGEQFKTRIAKVSDYAPGANPMRFVESAEELIAEYDFSDITNNKIKDKGKNGYDAVINGLSAENNEVILDGKGYINLPFDSVGYPYTVSLDLTIAKSTPKNALIFTGKDGSLFYNYDGTGKLGYERKGYTYLFDFPVLTDTEINITLTSTNNTATLFIDGYNAGSGKYYKVTATAESSSSFVLPVEKVGSGIIGKMSGLKIYNTAWNQKRLLGGELFEYGSTALGKPVEVSGVEGGKNTDGSLVYPQFDPKHAVDGDINTRISLNKDDNAWVEIDLQANHRIDKININFNETPKGYKILVSSNGIDYTEIYSSGVIEGSKKLNAEIVLDKPVTARYVKYQQTEMFEAYGSKFSGNFNEIAIFGYDGSLINQIIETARDAAKDAEDSVFLKKFKANIDELESGFGSKSMDELTALINYIEKQTSDLIKGETKAFDIDFNRLDSLLGKQSTKKAYEQYSEYAVMLKYDMKTTQEKIDRVADYISVLLYGEQQIDESSQPQNTSQTKSDESKESPVLGDNNVIIIILAILLIGGIGAVIIKRRSKQQG